MAPRLTRRRLLGALGSAALLGACAAPPAAPSPTPTAAAPSLAATAAALGRDTAPAAAAPATAAPATTVPAAAAPAATAPATAAPATGVPATAIPATAVPSATAPARSAADQAAPTTVVVPTATPTLVPPKPTLTPTPRPVVPTPTPGPAPDTLEIPKLGITAPIKAVGTRPTGEMDAPDNPDDVGWFMGGPKPGEPGNAILTGHLDWAGPPTQPAVFWRLKELAPGDQIRVRTGAGPLTFVVESTTTYDRLNAPVDRILGWAMGKVITIITCEGQFLPAERDYTHRRVVRARLT